MPGWIRRCTCSPLAGGRLGSTRAMIRPVSIEAPSRQLGQRPVQERVGTELLHDAHVHGEGPRLVLGDEVERLRAEAGDDAVGTLGRQRAQAARRQRDARPPEDGVPVLEPELGDVHARRADETGDEDVGRLLVEPQRGVALLEDPVPEHRHPVAHRHGLDLVVGDVDGGGGQPALQRGDLGAGLHAQLGVEVGQRLVHQEHLRRADDRPAHRDPLALAAGERLRLAVEELLQVEDLARPPRPGSRSPPCSCRRSSARSPCCPRPSCAGRARSSGRPSRCRGPWTSGS